jgi:glutamate-1-semialdehyde 2,1-aminomutase
MTSRNESLFERARQRIPAGVNSPVRAFGAVGGTPPFLRARLGRAPLGRRRQALHRLRRLLGPMVLGHTHPRWWRRCRRQPRRALSFGAPTEAEIELAEAICRLVPSIEMVRLVSSGTEATMTAIRLARGHTGRSLIVKFEGCYHGHADSLLVKAGSGALTFGNPSSAGVPPETAAHTWFWTTTIRQIENFQAKRHRSPA